MPERLRFLGVVPPTGRYVREDRCQTPVRNLATIALRPPIDLLYAAAAAESAGAECRLRDYPAEDAGWPDLEADLRRFAPQVLLISATTLTLRDDAGAAAVAKRLDPRITVLAKGAHFSVRDVDALERHPSLDAVIRGEVEDVCAELAEGRPLGAIAGLTWREGGPIVRNPDRPFRRDLDTLAFPARHLLRNDLYVRPDTGEPQTTVVTSRGCPYHCTYCLANLTAGTANRLRSPRSVVEELRECVARHGIRSFLFRSDLFTRNREWVVDLCEAILEAKLSISWACNSRTDSLDAATLAWMKRAGCWIVAFGVESGDQATLDRLEKHARADEACRAIRLCREAGVKSSAYLLVGLPWDTPASIDAQAAFARAMDPDVLEVFYAYPFPGTPLHRQCVEQGLIGADAVPPQAYDAPAFPVPGLTAGQLRTARRRILRSFYLRPRKVFGVLRGAESPAALRGYLRAGLVQLRQLAFAG